MEAGLVPEARAEPGVEFVRLGPSQLSFPRAPWLRCSAVRPVRVILVTMF